MESVEATVVRNIVTRFPEVERIILFGSRSRGDARPDSDWDFLIIMPSTQRTVQRGIAIRRVARIRGIPMDFLVSTPEEAAEGFSMMADDILHEGKILYERSG
jgi:predicted nucleotidyltransferase